jgi:ATP-binding cassette subfamily B protein
MDCGPAALKALLEGHGLPVSYSRLRTACQTEVDGTSIDTLEDLAGRLGLEVDQVMVPADHVLLTDGRHLPAIAVVVGPTGATHFIVIWRAWGPFVQIMDPARGRVWTSRRALLADLYEHRATVPSDDWRTWAGTEEFLDPLRERLRQLGLSAREREAAIERAVSDASWRGLGVLDASARMLAALRAAGTFSRRDAVTALRALARRDAESDLAEIIPAHYWSVLPADQDGTLTYRGAVLVQAAGRSSRAQTAHEEPAASALRSTRRDRPLRVALSFLRADGVLTPAVAASAALIAILGVALEAALLRSVLDVARELRLPEQGLLAGLALGIFAAALLGAEWVLGRAERRAGRHLEARLRVAVLSRVPRLPDAFLQSRPISDILERAHSGHLLRDLPQLGVRMARLMAELFVTALAVAWLAPDAAWLAFAAAGAAAAVPLVGHRVLAARDLRVRTHAGALERFHLDALLGRTAIDAHGARPALESEHERLLAEWARASVALQRGSVAVETVQMLVGFLLAGWMLMGRLATAETAGLLLLAYWMLNLPAIGYELALYAREYPAQRNTLLRLLDVLEAPLVPEEQSVSREAGTSIDLREVVVHLGGQPVLDVDLHIAAGGHVAIVGASGAGKSTLAGVLLGWHEPSHGQLLVGNEVIDARTVRALRRETAWVDPAVQVWNRSLLENLTSGAGRVEDVAPVIEAAGLMPVLTRLPEGLSTSLGEGGGLLSAGEAQRVRLGRAMLRRGARLVILDEPFLGLERERRRQLLAEARRRWSASTLIYVTHDIAEARGFDRVLVMDRGRVVEDGDPRVLAQTMGSRYRRLLQAQEGVQARFATSEWRRVRLENGRLVQDYANAAIEHSA